MHRKRLYSKFFWSVFSRIWTEYRDLYSSNSGKYGLEILSIRTPFTQWKSWNYFLKLHSENYTIYLECIIVVIKNSATKMFPNVEF